MVLNLLRLILATEMSESKPVAKPAGQLAKMEEGRAGKAEAAKPTPKSVATQITDQLDKVGRNAREAEGRRLAGVSVLAPNVRTRQWV